MIQRQTAKKCSINHLLNSVFVKKAELEPGYFDSPVGELYRVNVFGVVVQKISNTELVIDDGTGMMQLRFFNETPAVKLINLGDPVLVIGRPREYGNEKYIACEIISKIDGRWLELRKRELEQIKDVPKPTIQKQVEAAKQEKSAVKSDFELIYMAIKELDTGKGALIDDVISRVRDPGAEKKIIGLIEAGEIFEITSGRIKLLF
ncbi:MAG: hypothetical protein V1659_02085 [Candidatus Woesearchaeota archaeon]